MSRQKSLIVNYSEKAFGIRFKEAFNNIPNKEIAKLLKVSEPAITSYTKGRIPPAEKLIEIFSITNCNIHWLLTGLGEKKFIKQKLPITLVFHGSGGGFGTTTASVIISIILSQKGKKVLLVENGMGMDEALLVKPQENENKASQEIKRGKLAKTALARKIKTVFENIDIFIPTNMRISDDIRDMVETFPKKNEEIAEIESISDTMRYIEDAKADFPDIELLGVFINHIERKIKSGPLAFDKLYQEIKDFVGEKMFRTMIERDINSTMLLSQNIKQFSVKNTKLLKNYENLLNEILLRLEIPK